MAYEQVIIVGMLITLSVVALFELRYMRSRRKKREVETDLPDRAHNAILTTKAIAESIARGGVRSAEAEGLVQEAERAVRERHFRVAIDILEKAKGVLRNAKLRQEQRGDIAKLDEIAKTKGPVAEDSVTEKERLKKELPPNYLQSKFSMGVARDDIAAAKLRGESTGEAERLLASAQQSFDRADYDAALKEAIRARRTLGGDVSEEILEPTQAPVAAAPAPPTPAAKTRTCTRCGAPLAADDGFCRKCGVKIAGPRTCASCGAEVAVEDAFCRTCGASVP